jgi:DNA (cytosine-5)-methyltransferase 1
MKFLSVCSGIEAASVAWHPLGWTPLAFSEIEPFPRAVLAHHYPDVPLHGDFTVLRDQEWIVDADVLVGGTPCQAFSVAGLRKSLDDDRGNLSLEFVRLADAIDHVRRAAGREPGVIVWENVPGVLSVKDNAFGCFLAALAGDVTPIDPPRGKWSNAGVVDGPQRTVAWRVLDAQYFGLAQRRRRVFVVASSRDGFYPAEVLLEFEGLRRDFAPSREKGQTTAGTIDASLGSSRGAGTNPGALSHWDGDFPNPTLNQSAKASGGVGASNQELFSQRGAYLAPAVGIAMEDPVPPLMARSSRGGAQTLSPGHQTDGHMVAVMAHGQGGAEISFDRSPTLTCIHEAPIVAGALLAGGHTNNPLDETLVTHSLRGASLFVPATTGSLTARFSNANGAMEIDAGLVIPTTAHSLRGEGFDASEGGTGRGTPLVPVAFDVFNHRETGDIVGALREQHGTNMNAVHHHMAVRRLTPVECERLQGFPDAYTMIPWKKKSASECPDGPRYKALGNSMAVPVMAWIGRRIAERLQ